MTINDDYQPGDEFDWDFNDLRQRCKHGTFIGSACGPDLLCHWCEMGTTDEEYQEAMQERERQELLRLARYRFFDESLPMILTFTFKIQGDVLGFSHWLDTTLAEIRTTPVEDLREYVR